MRRAQLQVLVSLEKFLDEGRGYVIEKSVLETWEVYSYGTEVDLLRIVPPRATN